MGQVQFLVGELRSHKPFGMPPHQKKKKHPTHKVGEKEKKDEEEEVGRREGGKQGRRNEGKEEGKIQ